MSGNFLLRKDLKDIHKSFFTRGFAIPVDKQEILSRHLSGGWISPGNKRPIKILLNGKSFDATVRSVGFKRKNYPTHSAIWQINWSVKDIISKAVTEIFFKSYSDENEDGEFFVLYSTAAQDVFRLEPIFKRAIVIPKISEFALESLLELPALTGEAAALIERCNLLPIREMNLNLGEDLKRNYDYRCQICGRNFGEFYGVNLVDCHHIAPFSESLNNDASNLLIVCPNHHRIIHAAKPTFDRQRKLYLYPNGHEESLQLNDHL